MIEDYHAGTANPTNNPHYETVNDTIETLNLGLAARIAAVAAAALVELAAE
jgi:hypothetical protein